MGRRAVPRRDVPALLEELGELGARNVRRHPSGLDGRVEVTWDEAPFPEEVEARYAADMEAWQPGYAITAGFVVVLALVTLILVFV